MTRFALASVVLLSVTTLCVFVACSSSSSSGGSNAIDASANDSASPVDANLCAAAGTATSSIPITGAVSGTISDPQTFGTCLGGDCTILSLGSATLANFDSNISFAPLSAEQTGTVSVIVTIDFYTSGDAASQKLPRASRLGRTRGAILLHGEHANRRVGACSRLLLRLLDAFRTLVIVPSPEVRALFARVVAA
jgi:hypothetical protein